MSTKSERETMLILSMCIYFAELERIHNAPDDLLKLSNELERIALSGFNLMKTYFNDRDKTQAEKRFDLIFDKKEMHLVEYASVIIAIMNIVECRKPEIRVLFEQLHALLMQIFGYYCNSDGSPYTVQEEYELMEAANRKALKWKE